MTEITDISGRKVSSPFASLLGAQWLDLPRNVRERFAPRRPASTRIYTGEVLETRLSFIGRMLANLARLVGGPMPFTPGATGASVVVVTDVPGYRGNGGVRAQVWTRTYARAGKFPQAIQSAKCFTGPTGLEECLGYGLVMRLAVSAEGRSGAADLVFRSTAFFVRVAGMSMKLPTWFSPGLCEVRHHDEGCGSFTFTLTITHPLFGRLVRQVARYADVK